MLELCFLSSPFRSDNPAESTTGLFIAALSPRAVGDDPRSDAQHLQAAAHHLQRSDFSLVYADRMHLLNLHP